MEEKLIITIGRELGSSGGLIGRALAEKLGVNFYDKELIEKASEASGLCKEVFETHDEKPFSSFFYSLVTDAHSYGQAMTGFMDVPLNQKVFLAQFETIQNIAKDESCVIVGRCADYALAEHKNLISVFITADMADRVEKIAREHELTQDKAVDLIAKTDKKRANYYNYYSNKKWGAASTYDLCINSSKTGVEGAVEIILNFIEQRDKKF